MPVQTPCLWFDGDAEQAATFYTSVFPNSAVTDVRRNPDGSALVVEWTLDGQPYMGLNGGPGQSASWALSLSISCTDQAEVDHYWDALSEGGEESMCGWLRDRFGFWWQVVPTRLVELVTDPDPDRARRAQQAMLGMHRIVVAELEAAADDAAAAPAGVTAP
ncbi:VOC family protein [Modestobacter sp. L9-4]|uniref:VOC family protein n=1 Tax=Modestobacter sp. L9-4 TaxID=2851567 RepID=UPI001C753A15|nr:VOC family protein [Modestobacter sp. L9-4]QXG76385.1 VOC family protein [Modestobacter sp. L9-4]